MLLHHYRVFARDAASGNTATVVEHDGEAAELQAIAAAGRAAPALHAPAPAAKARPNGHANGLANGHAEDPFPMDPDAKLRDF